MAADKEFNNPTHEYHVTEEFSLPEEVQHEPSEFNADTSVYDAKIVEAVREKKKKTRTKTMILQVAAAMSAIIIAKDSFSIDLLGNDIFNGDLQPSHQEEQQENKYVYPFPLREDVRRVAAHVSLRPDGSGFIIESNGVASIYDARRLADERGYDIDTQEITKTEYELEGTENGQNYYTYHVYLTFYKKGYVPPQDEAIEEADTSFPVLGNLYPGGAVPHYGALGEEYVKFEGDGFPGGTYFAYTGEAYIGADGKHYVPGVEELAAMGARYDYSSNTLYLNDFKGAGLNINWMGNGFKIVVSGNCELDHLVSWGFAWGGSVTITGDGTLTINKSKKAHYGIILQAEKSESCLMIDSGVTVDVYGLSEAVCVEDSTAEKSIYYLKPLSIGGGKRVSSYDSTTGAYDCIITDKDDSVMTHVLFSR